MRKLIFFLILSIVSLVFAETNVTANIVGDSTWTVANSPYIIVNNIRVEQNCSLTIEDGVYVKFNDGRQMEIRGDLTANGATFTSGNAEPSVGSWEQIYVNSYYGANLTMDNCVYEYAKQLNLNAGAQITNSTFRHLLQYGIYHTSGNLIVEDCNINLDGYTGYGYGIFASGDSLQVRRTIVTNSDIALQIDTANDIILEDVQFNDSRWPVNIDNSSPGIETIGNNTFSNNEYNGVHVDLYNFSQSEWQLPYFPIPYFFNREFTILENNTLTIASENILKFNHALRVAGKLIADANENEAIYFTSIKDDNLGGDTNSDSNNSTPTYNSWPGVIFLDSSDDTSIMRRCDLRYAGSTSTSSFKGAINTYNASPTIENSNFSNNTFGFCLFEDSNPAISNNSIGASYLTPVAISFDADPVFTDNTLSFSDNHYDAIGILPGNMVADGHIIQRDFTDIPNITYLLLGDTRVTLGNELIVDPGVVIKSLDCRLWVDGKLTVNGTANENVVFTSVKDDAFGNPLDTNKDGTVDSPVVGNWQGIIFTHTSSDESLINYAVVKYGDFDWYIYGDSSNNHWAGYGSIVTFGANPTISNCIIKDNQTGIACWDDSNPTIINNQFFNSTWTPISMSCPADPTISGNTFTNVTNTALGILRGEVFTNGNLKSRDVAGFDNISYSMRDVVTINSGVEITVDPNVVIKHHSNAKWIVDGGLKINGTSDNRVVFTSIKDDNVGNPSDTNGDGNATSASPNDWNWIEYNETSDDAFNTLASFDVKFAEYGLKYISASGNIDNATFTDNYYHGFWCDGNSAPTMTNSQFINNNESPIAMSLTSDPTFENVAFSGNGTNGIRIIEGTLGIDASLRKRSLAGFDNIAYILNSDLTISTNATLTIEPGVVIKFDYGYNGFEIMVHGGFIAAGTPDEKIIFTDIRDDSVAGDTNNDGNNTSPDRGWWHGILFYDESNDAVNKLSNCEFKYGGNDYYWHNNLGDHTRWGTIKIQSAYVDIDSCLISHSESAGISVFGSGNPDISNCEMYNITRTPIHMDMFANPTFENNSALNVGYLGIGLRQATIAQTATVPVRNFAGYENIPYIVNDPITINSGTSLTIPAGVVFKNTYNGSFIVNGEVHVEGTTENPVVFTDDRDDDYGNPSDTNQNGSATLPAVRNTNLFAMNDVSNDASSFNNAIFRYQSAGIEMQNASPTITNCRFDATSWGIYINGVSEPVLTGNIFHNLEKAPVLMSLVSYPSVVENNVISGSTWKVLEIVNETLAQDVYLPKRDFGGVSNITYLWNQYTVGTGAVLTMQQGIVNKFWHNGWLKVRKGLICEGTNIADSSTVFTSMHDDFYGGDTNSNLGETNPNSYKWSGLIFEDESLDPHCILDGTVHKYAYNGVTANNASPTITKATFRNCERGVVANGASNPTINWSDFEDINYEAVKNTDQSYDIDATNNWWGDNSGPSHAANPEGTGETVTDGVVYTPWISDGAHNPIMGDVSLNGQIQAFDASLGLKSVVDLVTLNPIQEEVANVSGDSDVTAYDASLILQYVVGLIDFFPAEVNRENEMSEKALKYLARQNIEDVYLTIESGNYLAGMDISVPVKLERANGVSSVNAEIKFDPNILSFNSIDLTDLTSEFINVSSVDEESGIIKFAIASANLLENDGVIANLNFATSENVYLEDTELVVNNFTANERNHTTIANSGNIRVEEVVQATEIKQNYPNPFNLSSRANTIIRYTVADNDAHVSIKLYNVKGQFVNTLVDDVVKVGPHTVEWNGSNKNGETVTSGVYFYRMKAGNKVETRKMLLIK